MRSFETVGRIIPLLLFVGTASVRADFREFRDAAYTELPDGKKFIVVILTRGAGDEKALLPAIGRHLLTELGKG